MSGRLFVFLLVFPAFVLTTAQVGRAQTDVPVPETYGDAMRWYRKAAEAGDPKAMFYLGLTLEQGLQGDADASDAVDWYRRAAAAEYPLAQFKLGLLHQFGQLVARDLALAREWYEKAAGQGLADAQYNLAVLLELGEGGPADPERAVSLYRKAARAGIIEAFLNLGNLYARGEEIDQDLVEALKWLILAKQNGLDQADSLRASILRVLNEVEHRDAQARARRWERGVGE